MLLLFFSSLRCCFWLEMKSQFSFVVVCVLFHSIRRMTLSPCPRIGSYLTRKRSSFDSSSLTRITPNLDYFDTKSLQKKLKPNDIRNNQISRRKTKAQRGRDRENKETKDPATFSQFFFPLSFSVWNLISSFSLSLFLNCLSSLDWSLSSRDKNQTKKKSIWQEKPKL